MRQSRMQGLRLSRRINDLGAPQHRVSAELGVELYNSYRFEVKSFAKIDNHRDTEVGVRITWKPFKSEAEKRQLALEAKLERLERLLQ